MKPVIILGVRSLDECRLVMELLARRPGMSAVLIFEEHPSGKNILNASPDFSPAEFQKMLLTFEKASLVNISVTAGHGNPPFKKSKPVRLSPSKQPVLRSRSHPRFFKK